SHDGKIDLDAVVGHPATIRLDSGKDDERFFNGIVSRLVQLSTETKFAPAAYRATIVPWLWFLTRTSDCYIFQELSVPDIIKDIFNFYGFSDFENRLTGEYEPKDYCVQYRETDFNFISRLMEQEGIYYFFEHKNGKHTLVLADAISAHNPFKGYKEIIFHEAQGGGVEKQVITNWSL